MMHEGKIGLKEQRNNYLLTIGNDTIIKERPTIIHKYFEQVGAGQKAFGKLWDNSILRIIINLCLPIIMLGLDLLMPLLMIIKLLVHKKKKISIPRLYISHDRLLYSISKRIGINKKEDVWLRLSDDTFIIGSDYKSITIIDLINYTDVIKSVYQSFLSHIKVILKYGYRYYFLSYKAFNWFLTDYALRHVPVETDLYFSCICDRYAILIDKLPQKNKNLIQHGAMHFASNTVESKYLIFNNEKGFYIWDSLYRCSPTRVFCFTPTDQWALQNSVIANNPKYIYIGYGFKPAFKPSRKSVLIVGNYYAYKDKEEKILHELQDLNIDMYLKNHPSYSDKIYEELKRKYSFHFLCGLDLDFPDVDLLISYNSTLAYEYASIGTPVLYYGHFNLEEIKEKVKKIIFCE